MLDSGGAKRSSVDPREQQIAAALVKIVVILHSNSPTVTKYDGEPGRKYHKPLPHEPARGKIALKNIRGRVGMEA